MFAAWLAIFSAVHPLRKTVIFCIVFLVFAAAAYQLTYSSVTTYYSRLMGPLSMFPWWFILWYFSIFLIIPSVPIVFLIIVKLFRAPVTLRSSILCTGVWLLSFPIAMMLLALVNHRGQPDMLHAIKSGFVIPFLILSLCIPFVFDNERNKGQQLIAGDVLKAAPDS